MNLLFKCSPFAPRLVSSSVWTPVQHNWYQVSGYCDADLYPCLAVWAKTIFGAHCFFGMTTWHRQAWRLLQVQLRSAATWVYFQQEVVCGFIAVHPLHHIAGLFVEPARKGMGIGNKLLSYAYDLVGLTSVDVYSLKPARPTEMVSSHRRLPSGRRRCALCLAANEPTAFNPVQL